MHLTMSEIIARVSLPEYVGRFTDVTQKGNEYVCCCPFHDDSKPSMQMYIKGNKWRYICQPCGAKGDLVDFVMNYDDVDYVGAKKILMGENEELRTAPVKKIIVKPDPYADFEPLPLGDNYLTVGAKVCIFNPKSNKSWWWAPVMVHPYSNGYVIRLMVDGDKWTPTVRWCKQLSTGNVGWVFYKFIETEREFYGELNETGKIILVEGEKAADAGIEIFKGTPTNVISWWGGTEQVMGTDWSQLKGREIIALPDNDQPGHDAMHKISQIIDIKGFVITRDEKKGFDIADRNFTREELINYMRPRFGALTISEKLK